jgi:DNA-binding response OmpR family regulator
MPLTSPARILLIDDDVQVRQSIKRLFEQRGYLVATHDGGPGCSYEASRFAPDVVLVDVKMPFLSGDSLVLLLGETAGATRPTVLLYSGISRDELEKTAKQCGADGFISKSDSLLDLTRTVSRSLRDRNRTNSMPAGDPRAR